MAKVLERGNRCCSGVATLHGCGTARRSMFSEAQPAAARDLHRGEGGGGGDGDAVSRLDVDNGDTYKV